MAAEIDPIQESEHTQEIRAEGTMGSDCEWGDSHSVVYYETYICSTHSLNHRGF